MSSIPVISFQVIRQVLAWSGFPDPDSLRTVSNFTFPNGKYQATITATWQAADLLTKFTGIELEPGSDHGLLTELRECFAADIIPVFTMVDSKAGTVTAILSCTVEAHDHE